MSILQIGLGQLYYQGGRGVEVDHELAFYYFSKASAGGNPTADAYLGKIYAEGSGSIDQDYAAAYEYFTKAAEEVGKHSSSSKRFVCLKLLFEETISTVEITKYNSLLLAH